MAFNCFTTQIWFLARAISILTIAEYPQGLHWIKSQSTGLNPGMYLQLPLSDLIAKTELQSTYRMPFSITNKLLSICTHFFSIWEHIGNTLRYFLHWLRPVSANHFFSDVFTVKCNETCVLGKGHNFLAPSFSLQCNYPCNTIVPQLIPTGEGIGAF